MTEVVLKKRWIRDCIPTIISLMINALYNVVDGLFVGNSVGELGLSAINIGWPIIAVIIALGTGIGGGGGILYSHNQGSGDESEGNKIFQTTVFTLFIVGVFALIIFRMSYSDILVYLGAKGEVYQLAKEYVGVVALGAVFQILGSGFIPLLRNRNLGVQAMITMIISMMINIIANYIAIFELGMGIKGAAIGTVIAQSFTVVVSIYLIYFHKKQKFTITFELPRVWNIIKTGAPAFGIYLAPSIILIFTNLQCLKYGGDSVVAAYAVISYIVFPITSVLGGVGDGSQPLMSYLNGSGEEKSLEYIKKIASKFVIALGIICYIIIVLSSTKIPDIFKLSEASCQYFITGIIICGLNFLFAGSLRLRLCYMNSTLRSKHALHMVYLENIITFALIMILPRFLGTIGIWLTFGISQIVMLIILHLLSIGD